MTTFHWNNAYVYGWIAILTILTGYELYAVFFGHKYDVPLTWVTVRYVPWWVTLPFLVWLLVHFALRYANPNYLKTIT